MRDHAETLRDLRDRSAQTPPIGTDRTPPLAFVPSSGQPAPLAQAIERLISQPDLARRLGQAARARASTSFSLEKTVERHIELFEQLLSAPARTR